MWLKATQEFIIILFYFILFSFLFFFFFFFFFFFPSFLSHPTPGHAPGHPDPGAAGGRRGRQPIPARRYLSIRSAKARFTVALDRQVGVEDGSVIARNRASSVGRAGFDRHRRRRSSWSRRRSPRLELVDIGTGGTWPTRHRARSLALSTSWSAPTPARTRCAAAWPPSPAPAGEPAGPRGRPAGWLCHAARLPGAGRVERGPSVAWRDQPLLHQHTLRKRRRTGAYGDSAASSRPDAFVPSTSNCQATMCWCQHPLRARMGVPIST